MPKRGCDVKSCEVAKCFKLVAKGYCEPISFTVPRKVRSSGCLQQVKNVIQQVLYILHLLLLLSFTILGHLSKVCVSLVAQLASVYLWLPQHDMIRSISSPPLGEMSVQPYPRTQQTDFRQPVNLESRTVMIRHCSFHYLSGFTGSQVMKYYVTCTSLKNASLIVTTKQTCFAMFMMCS